MKRISLLLPLSLILATAAASPSTAAPQRRAVFLILDKITLADLTAGGLPNLRRAMDTGGIALMNARTGGTLASEHAYVTIGAGSRAAGTPEAGAAYAAGDPLENGTAGEILRRNTGYQARPGNLVLPAAAGIAALNLAQDHTVLPGLLGKTLHKAGLTTAAFGNADSPDSPGRYLVSLAMDDHGIVDTGSVGAELLRADPSWPFGIRTDLDALIQAFDRLAGKASFIAIDLGDTTRLDAYATNMSPERSAFLRHRALRAADAFLGRLRARLDTGQTLLVILSPSPSIFAQEDANPMTPVIAVGPGFSKGLLTSATTRRPGIVTNTDLAPTVLSFLGQPVPPEMSGRPLQSVPGDLTALQDRDRHITAMALWQQPVLKLYTVVLDIVFIAGALFILWRGLPGTRVLQALLLLVAAFPLALLLAPLRRETGYFVAWLAGLTVLLGALCFAALRRRLWPLFLLAAGTTLAVAIDQLLGAPLAQYSLLSYSPISGSRYYGLGNEYMGVLLGAATIGSGLIFTWLHGRRWLHPAVVLFFMAIVVVIGAPHLGTNVGGTMAAVVGFGVAALVYGERRVSPRLLLSIAAAAFGALMLLALLDSLRAPGAQTHLGRLVSQVTQEGARPFWEVVQRKLAMNLKLVRFSGWSRVVLFALAAMLVTARSPSGRGQVIAMRYPYVAKAILASLAGAVAAFLLNDSGIVAAGTLLVFPTVTWLYLLLEDDLHNEAGSVPTNG